MFGAGRAAGGDGDEGEKAAAMDAGAPDGKDEGKGASKAQVQAQAQAQAQIIAGILVSHLSRKEQVFPPEPETVQGRRPRKHAEPRRT